MVKRKADLHVVPDPKEPTVFLVTTDDEGEESIPVIPTPEANSFWSRLVHPAIGPDDDEDDDL
ncbi:MAG TPA: hypothetical protein VEI83_13220 [Acidimicrobiales bacterium]|nr:hypothetical protein [Acidimicrobiales bacterium]